MVSLEIVAVAVVIDLGEIPWSNLSWVVIPVLLTVGFDSMAVFVSSLIVTGDVDCSATESEAVVEGV